MIPFALIRISKKLFSGFWCNSLSTTHVHGHTQTWTYTLSYTRIHTHLMCLGGEESLRSWVFLSGHNAHSLKVTLAPATENRYVKWPVILLGRSLSGVPPGLHTGFSLIPPILSGWLHSAQWLQMPPVTDVSQSLIFGSDPFSKFQISNASGQHDIYPWLSHWHIRLKVPSTGPLLWKNCFSPQCPQVQEMAQPSTLSLTFSSHLWVIFLSPQSVTVSH